MSRFSGNISAVTWLSHPVRKPSGSTGTRKIFLVPVLLEGFRTGWLRTVQTLDVARLWITHLSLCLCNSRAQRKHDGTVVRGQDVPPDQMSPRTRDPRTRCPPSGQDVPRQDRMSPLPLPQTHVSLASVQT